MLRCGLLPKFLSLGVVLLALGVLGGAALAQPCNVSLPPAQRTAAGADFVVPVDVADATGALGMTFKFTYDAAQVVATSVSRSTFTSGLALQANLAVPGLVQLTLYGTTPLAGGGTIAWVQFHTLAGAPLGASPLHWTTAEINEVPQTACDGQVTVVAPAVTLGVPDFCAAPGTTVVKPVTGDPATGLLALDLVLQYDPAVLLPVNVAPTAFTAGFSVNSNVVSPGRLLVSLYGATPLPGSGALVDVSWQVLAGVGSATPIHVERGDVNEGALATSFDDGAVTTAADADHDGFTTCEDCNDADPNVYPGAPEICDGVDNQCPGDPGYGQVDEGVGATFYRDADGDAYGNAAVTVTACAAPSGYVADHTDCDDTNAAVHPGATEIAGDGLDESCDGLELCYVDGDHDTYGSTATVLSTDLTCRTTGASPNALDCNDANAAIHPGAPELPADGVDENCDGQESCWADTDGDGFGGAATVSTTNFACNGAGQSANALDCDDTRADIHPGVPEICNGLDDDCDGLVDEGNPGGGARCGASNVGECAPGLTACTAGSRQCAYEGLPQAEACDGRDNDCNGRVDDGCTPQACNVRLPLETKSAPGEDLVVPITAGDATGATGFTFELAYDSTKLTAVAVYPAALTAGFALDYNVGTPGTVLVSLYGTTPVTGGGIVGYVLFHVAGGAPLGPTALHWVSVDVNEGGVPSTACDGQANLVASQMQLSIGDACGAHGTSFTVTPVTAVSATGLLGLDLTIAYDPAVLAPVGVTTTNFTSGFEVNSRVTAPGRLEISLFGTIALTGGGTLVDVTWSVLGAAPGATPLDLAAAEVNEGALLVTLDDGVFTIAPDGDGDGWAVCVDCNDANAHVYPGAPEICDGIDNQCPGDPGYGVVDDVPAPTGTPALSVTRSGATIHLSWTGVAGATGYDVVRGLSAPVLVAGDFATAVDACVANDLAATTTSDAALPPAGEIYWYAVRAMNCGGAATWDASPNDQVRSRDPYIDASPNVCP